MANSRYHFGDQSETAPKTKKWHLIWPFIIAIIVGIMGSLIYTATQNQKTIRTINVSTIESIVKKDRSNIYLKQMVQLDQKLKPNALAPNEMKTLNQQRAKLVEKLGHSLATRYQKLLQLQNSHERELSQLELTNLTGYLTLATYDNDLYVNQLEQQVNQTNPNQLIVLQRQANIIQKHKQQLVKWLNHTQTAHVAINNAPYINLNPMIVTTDYYNAYFDTNYDSPMNKRNQAIQTLLDQTGPKTSIYGPYLNPKTGQLITYNPNAAYSNVPSTI